MKDVKRMVEEANLIAKQMAKDINFSAIYVSKFDNQSVYGSGSAYSEIDEMKTEIEIKVENFDNGQIYHWSTDKLSDKLI